MSTHYGLQVESPFNLKDTAAVAISVKRGEVKDVDRGEVTGLLAIVVAEGGKLNYTENIGAPGLYHTYIYLQGQDSSVSISSRVMLKENIADISHQVMHEKDNTVSNIKTKGIVSGEGIVIYTSNISVTPNIKKIEGTQDAQFMLLEAQAKVKTIPGLSVYSEEVSCSHKVAVAPVDTKKLEFLAMRGYSKKQAEEVLITAFLR
jgi:Fe-S cluster assembly scaffold protein SufB